MQCRAPCTEQVAVAAACPEHRWGSLLDAAPLVPQPAGASGALGQEPLPAHGQHRACRAVPQPSGLREPLQRAKQEGGIKHAAIDLFQLF